MSRWWRYRYLNVSKRNAYIVAFILVTLASLIRIWLLHGFGSDIPYLTYYPAVIAAAVIGGFYVGMFVTTLVCLTLIFLWSLLVAEPFIKTPDDWWAVAIFILNGALISSLAEGLRRTGQRLKNEQELLECALKTAQQGFWDLNLKTQMVERTLLHDQIFGYASLLPEWTYEIFLRHVHPDDYHHVDQIVKAAIISKTPWEFQCRIYRADDNSIRWIWASGNQFKVNENYHLVGLVQDITRRKNNELELLRMTNKYNALLGATPDGLIISNKEGKIVFANPVAEEIFGYTQNELIGQTIEFLVPTHLATRHVKLRQQYLKNPHLRPMGEGRDLQAKHKDGHLFPVAISLSPTETAEGMLVIAAVRDITQQKLMEEKLKHLAEHDPLTGLINRPLFEDRVMQGIELAKRQRCVMAVCFLDLDNFKHVNDLYGHATGDLLLCSAAKRMKKCIRDIDTLARLGGDEFALILLNINEEQDAVNIAKKLLQRFSKGFLIESKTLNVTLSIGISLYPRDGRTQLIEKADAAMYYVKNHGKNNIRLFDTNLELPSQ